MDNEKVAKKKPHTEELPSPTSEVITPEQAGKQFMNHLAKQPEKMDMIMDKVMSLDLEKVLDKLGDDKVTVNDDDMKMLGEAIVKLDETLDKMGIRITELETLYNKLAKTVWDIDD